MDSGGVKLPIFMVCLVCGCVRLHTIELSRSTPSLYDWLPVLDGFLFHGLCPPIVGKHITLLVAEILVITRVALNPYVKRGPCIFWCSQDKVKYPMPERDYDSKYKQIGKFHASS